jgi:hypothetical protein
MIRVTTRSSPDAAGRKVDIHNGKELYVHWYFEDENTSKEELMALTLRCIIALSRSRNKRASGRDQSFYECRITVPLTETAGTLIGFGLSSPPGWEAAKEIRKQIPNTWQHWDSEIVYAYDLEIRPIGRYARGLAILYADYISSAANHEDVELRSATVKISDSDRSIGSPFPKLRSTPPGRQGLATFRETELELLNFVTGIPFAGTYVSLRRELKKQFGLTVTEFDEDTGRRGFVSVDWVFNDLGCDLSFHINKHLHPQLKYVVLAHELGHYITQFHFLLISQLVEQCSWHLPRYEQLYYQLVEQEVPDRSILEVQANRMATYLLIPRIHDDIFPYVIRGTTKDRGYAETLTDAHHIWFKLQKLFPETRDSYDYRSWSELAEALDRRDYELNLAPNNNINDSALYETMLAASLTRDTSQAKAESKDAFRRTNNVLRKLFTADFQRSIASQRPEIESSVIPPDGRRNDRLIISPLTSDSDQAPRFPLTPTAGGRYRAAYYPTSAARALHSWQEILPDVAMAIYRRKPPPSESVSFNPFAIRLGYRER